MDKRNFLKALAGLIPACLLPTVATSASPIEQEKHIELDVAKITNASGDIIYVPICVKPNERFVKSQELLASAKAGGPRYDYKLVEIEYRGKFGQLVWNINQDIKNISFEKARYQNLTWGWVK